MQPITSITLKKDTARQLSLALFDQNDEVIYTHEYDMVVADPSIVSPRKMGQTTLELRALEVGSTTITFTAKGVNRVLTVNVVAAVPTNLNVYEGEVTIISEKVYV